MLLGLAQRPLVLRQRPAVASNWKRGPTEANLPATRSVPLRATKRAGYKLVRAAMPVPRRDMTARWRTPTTGASERKWPPGGMASLRERLAAQPGGTEAVRDLAGWNGLPERREDAADAAPAVRARLKAAGECLAVPDRRREYREPSLRGLADEVSARPRSAISCRIRKRAAQPAPVLCCPVRACPEAGSR